MEDGAQCRMLCPSSEAAGFRGTRPPCCACVCNWLQPQSWHTVVMYFEKMSLCCVCVCLLSVSVCYLVSDQIRAMNLCAPRLAEQR